MISILKYGFTGYWFVFVLFEMYLIYFICDKILRKYKYLVMIGLSFAGIVFLAMPSLRGGTYICCFV